MCGLEWKSLGVLELTALPSIGADRWMEFVASKPPVTGDDFTLGVVDFSIFPHLDHPDMPENNVAAAEKRAAAIDGPAYAIDDQTAIQVVDGVVEVVSEGHWKRLVPARMR